MKASIPIFLVVALLTHLSHRRLDRLEQDYAAVEIDPRETLMSIPAVQFLSLGYPSLVADYYWLRAISEFGNNRLARAGLPNLPHLMERALTLDPYFLSAYIFAGTALTVKEIDPNIAIRLLDRGLRYRPDSWKIAFLQGFNSYYFIGDYPRAARAMAKAAQFADAPRYVGKVTNRLAAEAGEPEVGLRFLDAVIPEVQDPELADTYRYERKQLKLELHLKWLSQAVQRYRDRFETAPSTLEDLVRTGIMRGIPEEPLGGNFFIDDLGQIATTSEDQRLRLDERAKGVRSRLEPTP